MKKTNKILSVILAIIIAASLSLVAFGANITEADAKNIALKNAGFSESDVSYIIVKQDYENGVKTFEVEFFKGLNEYDYEIDAQTGAIISVDTDAPDYTLDGNYLSADAIKAIVIDYLGLENEEVTFTKCAVSKDDGRYEYDVELRVGYKVLYDVEVDGTTGKILEVDKEGQLLDNNAGIIEKIREFFEMISIFFEVLFGAK